MEEELCMWPSIVKFKVTIRRGDSLYTTFSIAKFPSYLFFPTQKQEPWMGIELELSTQTSLHDPNNRTLISLGDIHNYYNLVIGSRLLRSAH